MNPRFRIQAQAARALHLIWMFQIVFFTGLRAFSSALMWKLCETQRCRDTYEIVIVVEMVVVLVHAAFPEASRRNTARS